MITWPDILDLAKNGNPAPDRKVVKTDEEWRKQLRPDEYSVTRHAATERPFSSEMCSLFEPGLYSLRRRNSNPAPVGLLSPSPSRARRLHTGSTVQLS
jgi:hypothetical protein